MTIVGLVVICVCGSVSAAETRDAWVEVRSTHFVVVSNEDTERARAVAEDFETVRAVARQAMPRMRLDPRQPIVILAVRNEQSLRELLPQFWERRGLRPAGVFQRGPHTHQIALRVDTSRHERYQRVFHEYFHLLTRLNLPWAPAWFNEGLSEFWGQTLVRGRAVETGRPARHHLQFLTAAAPLPLEELLAMDRHPHETDPDKTSIFYAQSWALTHYLMVGMVGESSGNTGRALAVYLDRLERGLEPLEAAEQAFGDLEQLEAELRDYVRSKRWRSLKVSVPKTAPANADSNAAAFEVRTLSDADALAVRGTFLVNGQRPRAAHPLLAEALELDPDQALAHESLGYLHFRLNEHDTAAIWFRRAIALDPGSHLSHYYSAILTRATGNADASAQAERHLRRTLELNPTFAPAYARLSALCARDETRTRMDEAVALASQAVTLEPDNVGYWVDLGQLQLSLDRPDDARDAAERGLAVARGANTKELAASFMRRVEQQARLTETRESL